MTEKTEQQARQEILDLVAEYARKYKVAPMQQPYHEGERIPYASRVYDDKEMVNLVDSALEFWLTAGRYTEAFEQKFGEYLGVRYVSLVNSGSSANLLAFSTLTSPLPTCDIDVTKLEEAYSEKTKAVMIAHTLGNPFNLKAVKDFCDRHQLWLVEDNCDALGSTYTIDGETRQTGSIGDIGTSSFYPPHHMTMGEGGACYTNNPQLHRIMRSIRDWGRDCWCAPGHDNTCHHRFDGQYGELPKGYDHKYVYSHFGYNLKATDMQAAIGVAQLEKFPGFVARRKHNFELLKSLLVEGGADAKLILPEPEPHSDPSWFGFLMTCQEGVDRETVVRYIEDHGVQTRMLFAGNLIKHPCFDEMRATGEGYRVVGSLETTDRIMRDTFWVGLYPGMTDEKLRYMARIILEAIQQ